MTDDTPQVAVQRASLRLDLGMADDCGFVVRRGEEIVAAFTTCSEMCRWIETEWRQYDPPSIHATQDLPNIALVQPSQKRTVWGR